MPRLGRRLGIHHPLVQRPLPNHEGHTSKRARTSFSESPRHLLTSVEADILKKVVRHSVATALANMVLPVPGGPCNRIPFQGLCGTKYILTIQLCVSCVCLLHTPQQSLEHSGKSKGQLDSFAQQSFGLVQTHNVAEPTHTELRGRPAVPPQKLV